MSSDSAALSASEGCRVGGYILLSPIGHGTFAKVMLARHLVTGLEVAVKIIRRRDSNESFQEVTSLKMLNHPNIIKLFEVIDAQDQTFLFMENASSGHLLNYLQKDYPMAEDDARAKFRQMASAVEYCHHNGVIHRDLKLENILLDEENSIKVADFGFSTKFLGGKLQTFCGTLPYMAPELLKFKPYDGRKVDTWALGVILYAMVTGKLPFEKTNLEERKKKILSGHFHIPDSLSVECQELLKKLLTVDPSHRITVEEIMEDQWVNIGYEEAMRPYSEPPRGDIDPRVVEIMEKLGYKREEIEQSVSRKKYDEVMGTYMILQNRQNKMVGQTIRVRPCPASDPKISMCTMQGTPESGGKLEKCSSLPGHMDARVPSPPPHMERRTSSLPPRLGTSRTIATDRKESWTTISPRRPWSKMASPQDSLHSTKSIPPASLASRVPSSLPSPGSRTAYAVAHSSSSCTQGETPAYPSGSRHGQQGVARRVLRFLLKCICCLPSTKKQHHKRKRVKPI